MGLNIKQNKKDLYNMESSITDSSIHPDQKWVTENEAKKLLINRKFWKFMEDIIEIDMEFPMGYHVNGKYCAVDKQRYCEWWLEKQKESDDLTNTIIDKYNEVHDRLKLDFELK